MKKHVFSRVRKLFLGFIYVSALVLAAVLVYRTLLLTEHLPEPRIVQSEPTATVAAQPPPEEDNTAAFALLATPVPTPVTNVADEAEVTLPQQEFHPKTGRYVAAWLPPIFQGGAQASFEANKDVLDEVSPFWYSTDSTGRLYGDRDDAFVALAHEHNILVIPTIHNVGDTSAVIDVLVDPQLRTRHVQNILDEVLARNYDGIDIDYEGLDTGLREDFSAFIIELAETMHAHNKMLTIAVHAKDSPYGGLGGYQDWTVIGQYVDRMRIMTYDYHWRGGGPGPVAPQYWVESVAEYARSVVDPAKVVIGVPFYGYDWPEQGNAIALPWGDIEDLIDEQGLTVNLMQRNELGLVNESWFEYATEGGYREVWYMTEASLESKLELVKEMDLAGIAIWQLGYEKPEYWQVIRRELVEDPALIQREINALLPEH